MVFQGEYRGAAHNLCNLKYNNVREIPIFFHNLNYDSHLFIRELASTYNSRYNLEIVPLTSEKYIAITKKIPLERPANYTSKEDPFLKLVFKDSFRFLSKSLASLAQSLDKSKDFKILDKEFGVVSDRFKRKGVFPYHMIKSQNDYNLPFPSRDNYLQVSDDDYNYAMAIYKDFNCQNMGDYSDLYLKTDTLILTDIFEKLSEDCLSSDTYSLGPAHYLSAPGYSWDAMMRYTRTEIELISDASMLSFIKRGIRGGLCQVSHRKAEAKNHYVDDSIEKDSLDQNYLLYLDKVNLYGSTMSGMMPCGNYNWEDPTTFSLDEDAGGDKGYIVEVDLVYDFSLHDEHNDLPFCHEKMKVRKGPEKLLATLHDKQNYVASLRNIQQACRHGLRVTKLHRVLSFQQSPWLKKYIFFSWYIKFI